MFQILVYFLCENCNAPSPHLEKSKSHPLFSSEPPLKTEFLLSSHFLKIRQEAQHPPPQTQAERKGVHNLLTQAVFDIGTPILHTLICAGLNLMFSKTETTIRPNSSVLIKWGTPQNFLLAFIDELWNFWKIRILKKWKKHCWRYHHFKHVYQKPQSYEVQFLRYGVWQIFFVILDHFLPFYPPPPP